MSPIASVAALAVSTTQASRAARRHWSRSRKSLPERRSGFRRRANSVPSFRRALSRHDIPRSAAQTKFSRQKQRQYSARRDYVSRGPSQVHFQSRYMRTPSLFCCRCRLGRRAGRPPQASRICKALPRKPSSATSKHAAHHLAESVNFIGKSPTKEEAVTVVVEAESRRNANGPTGGQVPSGYRSQIL